MSSTWINGADLSRRYDSRYPGVTRTVTKGVLHTTETGSLPDYSGGAMAPNATLLWAPSGGMRVVQHFPLDMSARALKNLAGGVTTNTDGVAQFEIVGSCDPGFAKKYGYLYVPAAPDAFYEALAAFMRRVEAATSIPRSVTSRPWLAYPASYGNSPARMGFAEWDAFRGWCGHQHVAENDHGDPGALQVARLVAGPAAKPDPAAGVAGLIGEHYRALGGTSCFLGSPIGNGEQTCPDRAGKRGDFERGAIWWTEPTGAHEVHGAILGRYAGAGWEGGELRYPISDEQGCPDGLGRYSAFQGDGINGEPMIYWTPGTGAQVVKGLIRDAWAASRFEAGPLGYPVNEEHPVDGGVAQDFQGGTLLFADGKVVQV